jgi:hypothetical protein
MSHKILGVRPLCAPKARISCLSSPWTMDKALITYLNS